ncbi:MAG: metal-sensitive transcriptional regulator [Acidimicrobiaceae bacterium]|nr:metal-sensitive transcriptional regulator [Acidimicrobiaceae bacterium]
MGILEEEVYRLERDDGVPLIRLQEVQRQDLKRRLARVEGQVRGISKMIDDSRQCKDIVTQISAVSKALEQIGFRLVASQISYCLENPEEALRGGCTLADVEKLFLRLR